MTLKTRKIDGISFSFVNEAEFVIIYHDIFTVEDWRFTATTSSPLILDCGAHIGVSVLYFKKLYPQAKVIAFEPNPDTFKLLELNIKQNNLSDVKLVNAAISNSTGEMDFYICEQTSDPLTWSWGYAGVKNAWYNPTAYNTIKVPAVKLSSYLDQNIDFLKLDVEGMEEIVLKEIEGNLCAIKELRMEFHGGSRDGFNDIEEVLSVLERKGFKIAITHYNKLIKADQLEGKGPYLLIIYANKQLGALWWQIQGLRNINRIWRRVTGNSHPLHL